MDDKGKAAIRRLERRDLKEVSRIHREQFSGSRSSKLGSPFVRKMYQWFLIYQPDLALVATINGKPVGFVTGAVGGYGRRITRYAVKEIALGFLTHPGLWFNKRTFAAWSSYLQAFRPNYGHGNKVQATSSTAAVAQTDDKEIKASIASIAVTKAVQGQGVGKLLMLAFEDAAKGCGVTVMGLSVESDNAAARSVYEKSGWQADASIVEDGSVYYRKQLN